MCYGHITYGCGNLQTDGNPHQFIHRWWWRRIYINAALCSSCECLTVRGADWRSSRLCSWDGGRGGGGSQKHTGAEMTAEWQSRERTLLRFDSELMIGNLDGKELWEVTACEMIVYLTEFCQYVYSYIGSHLAKVVTKSHRCKSITSDNTVSWRFILFTLTNLRNLLPLWSGQTSSQWLTIITSKWSDLFKVFFNSIINTG